MLGNRARLQTRGGSARGGGRLVLRSQDSTGYVDVFEALPHRDDHRDAEAVVRAGLEGSPALLRAAIPIIHRTVLRFRLGPLGDPAYVLGWRIVSSEPDRVVLRAGSSLTDGELVGERRGEALRLTTRLTYRQPVAARSVWAVVGPLHRRLAPGLLARAARRPSMSAPAPVPAPGTWGRRTAVLPQGRLEYVDTAGEGPVVVLVNAVLTDESLWAAVVEQLAVSFRCVSVVLPLGAHRLPMGSGVDLSLRGQAHLLHAFLQHLEVEDATVCFNDWSGAQILVSEGWTERVARLVLISCETSGNYPPGLPGRFLALLGRVPGGLFLGYWAMLLPGTARLPFTLGRMSSRPVPRQLVRRWFTPGRRDPAVRRDLGAYVRGVDEAGHQLIATTGSLRSFAGPVLVVWGGEDRVMPRSEGEALAAAFGHSTFVTVPRSGTLVPLDQPAALATRIREFIPDVSGTRRAAPPGENPSAR